MTIESLLKILVGVLKPLWSRRRERVVDRRETIKTLAAELDKLADLMSDVLNVTAADGGIQPQKIPELEVVRQRVWNRWVSILSTDGYDGQVPGAQAEIEKAVNIAHAAPGSYVEEIYLVQVGLASGFVSREVRDRFARSIDAIRDATARMRLNA
jgi:hypothetical protein